MKRWRVVSVMAIGPVEVRRFRRFKHKWSAHAFNLARTIFYGMPGAFPTWSWVQEE